MQKRILLGKKRRLRMSCCRIVLWSLLLSLAACSPEGSGEAEVEDMPLSITSAALSGVATRTTWSDGSSIGVYRLSSIGYSETKSNVPYTYSSGSWAVASGSTPIYLTRSTANLCAYYPYSSDADYTDGTVSLTSQKYNSAADLCYQNSVTASSQTSASFTLAHAYALVTFTLTRDASYPANGACAISGISIAHGNIIEEGTLDMTTGSYATTTLGTVSYDPAITGIVSGTPATTSVLMVPVTATMSGNITLTFTVDGKVMTTTLDATTKMPALASGSSYAVAITIKGTALVVGGVTTTDWTDVTVTNPVNTVTMADEANCYMVPLGETVYLPVSRVTTAWTQINGSSYTLPTTWTAGLLWTTSSNGVSASGSVADISYNRDGGYIKVTAGCVEGNSLIAAYDADGGNILWSWHIWVTNYNPDAPTNGTTYNFNTNNPLTFMDRNLGATSTSVATLGTMGLLYQWGRKDPFPGASTVYYATNGEYNSLSIYNASGTLLTEGSQSGGTGIKSVLASATTTETKTLNLTNAIKNPMTFYYVPTGGAYIGSDWYTTTDDATGSLQNSALWGNSDYAGTPTAKTVFDPCPAGWRVPTWKNGYSPWHVFGTSTTNATIAISAVGTWSNGLSVTSVSAGYYPAAGYKESLSGTFQTIGSTGNYWSASTSLGNGYAMRHTSADIIPANSRSRAAGFSVRCVQE